MHNKFKRHSAGDRKFLCTGIFVAIITIFTVGSISLVSGCDSTPPSAQPSQTDATGQVQASDSSQPFMLDPMEVAGAQIITVNIKSVNLSNYDGKTQRTIMLVPQAEWQGDFSAARIAATMLKTAKEHLSTADMVNIYLLPLDINTEQMFDVVALGRLSMNKSEETQNFLNVQTRGYLPQELDFMALWDKRWLDFSKDGNLDSEALTKSITEELGVEAYGMTYPFITSRHVENMNEVFAALN